MLQQSTQSVGLLLELRGQRTEASWCGAVKFPSAFCVFVAQPEDRQEAGLSLSVLFKSRNHPPSGGGMHRCTALHDTPTRRQRAPASPH